MPRELLQSASLGFAYGVRPVINGVSLALCGGEVVGLLGPNGSGKSTLINLLLGHLRGDGEVRWDGRALGAWGRRELARRVAYLPQSPLFEAAQTVEDCLRLGRAPYWRAFGLEAPRDAAVVRAVSQTLELGDLMERRMDELSGGQRQRVFIGRCLAQEPAAMLLDEPNTFLDLRHQVELLRTLQKLAREKGIGILMASHDLNLAGAFADRLVLLSDGRVMADGPAGEVLKPELLARVYGVPMRRLEAQGGSGGGGGPPIVFPVV
jgi:iron complex transport system ATP-binding protein